MKYRKGYILIESVITLSVIMILASIIYSIVHLSINIKLNIEDKIELQQQAMEITNYIDELIGNSKGIIGITSKEEINNFLSVKLNVNIKIVVISYKIKKLNLFQVAINYL